MVNPTFVGQIKTGNKGPAGDKGETSDKGEQGNSGETADVSDVILYDVANNTQETPSTVAEALKKINSEGIKYMHINGGESAVALGKESVASGKNAIAAGHQAQAMGESSVAMGQGTRTTASASNAIALGAGSLATEANTVSVGSKDLERRIVNVAPGKISPTSTDAVNGSQLFALDQKHNQLSSRVENMNKYLRAGIAGAVATAGLPQATLPGGSMIAASAGTFGGQNAVAVGISKVSDSGKVVLKLSGSASTQGNFSGSVGVGYYW